MTGSVHWSVCLQNNWKSYDMEQVTLILVVIWFTDWILEFF